MFTFTFCMMLQPPPSELSLIQQVTQLSFSSLALRSLWQRPDSKFPVRGKTGVHADANLQRQRIFTVAM